MTSLSSPFATGSLARSYGTSDLCLPGLRHLQHMLHAIAAEDKPKLSVLSWLTCASSFVKLAKTEEKAGVLTMPFLDKTRPLIHQLIGFVLMPVCTRLPFLHSSRKEVYFLPPVLYDSDHIANDCALFPLSAGQSSALLSAASVSRPHHSARKPLQMSSSKQIPICVSWNKGACSRDPGCRYRHICATCYKQDHLARDCSLTPLDSFYRKSPAPASKASRPSA